MAFTHVWDSTAPLGTQIANLIDDDLRDLKTDIQERFSQFMSGLKANRPTPEAAFGSAGNGVLYFATDEKKLYAWGGAAWSEVACWQTFEDLTNPSVVNPAVETDLNTITIPAAFMSVGYTVEVYAGATAVLTGGQTPVCNLYIGSTKVASPAINNGGGDFAFLSKILVITSTKFSQGTLAQFGTLQGGMSSGSLTASWSSKQVTTENIANAIVIKTTVGATSNTYTGFGLYARVHR